MSCIRKLLDQKGDKEFIKFCIPNSGIFCDDNYIAVEAGGNYKGLDWCVTFNDKGFRCGYVAVPADHKYANEETCESDLCVHGGVTYCGRPIVPAGDEDCGDVWIGFDAYHAFDLRDLSLAMERFPEKRDLIEYMIKLEKEIDDRVNEKMSGYPGIDDWKKEKEIRGSVKTLEYIENEGKQLIDQIVVQ